MRLDAGDGLLGLRPFGGQVRGPLGVALGEVGRLLLTPSPLGFRRLPLGNELRLGDGQLLFQRVNMSF